MKLDAIKAALLASYEMDGGISHVDGVNLPSQESVNAIVRRNAADGANGGRICPPLFLAQGVDRIDPGCSARGKPTGEEGRPREKDRKDGQQNGILPRDVRHRETEAPG